jgi:hypothetical protein
MGTFGIGEARLEVEKEMCGMKVKLLAMGFICEIAANPPGHVVVTHTGSVHRYDEDEESKSTLASNGATA